MDLELLEKIGLKEKEARVYIALLKQGSCLANHLAKKTSILRSSIYDYLDVLVEKGLATYTIKSGKKFFQTAAPEKILDNFAEQQERQAQALQAAVLELSKFQNSREQKVKAEVFEGKEGIKTSFMRVLREKPKEILVFGSSGYAYKLIPVFMHHWHKQRAEEKILLRIIYNNDSESLERIQKGPPLKLAQVKLSPIKNFSFVGTLIYNNLVLILMLNAESPLAISIESKEIAKNYKNNFEILWKNSRPVNF